MSEVRTGTGPAASALVRTAHRALLALIPSHRATESRCWCTWGRDVQGAGHEDGCKQARLFCELAEEPQ